MGKASEWSGRDAAKDTLRKRMWRLLIDSGAAVGDPSGHIPNFVGADAAAERMTQMPAWAAARVVKSNPDAAQAPLRLRALQAGKIVYMAVPRLLDERCFVELTRETAAAANVTLEEAATHQIALKIGRLVAFDEMQKIDLVSVGCVAVARDGGRTGKGAGFADIELGLLRQFALVSPATPIVTTVHPLQIVDDAEITMRAHDSALNWIATADELIETHTRYPQPTGLVWDSIQPDQWEKIPVLKKVKK
jgi:5-formyltetrahydrofolate cyclo-ligase